jgi:hypothetical protein
MAGLPEGIVIDQAIGLIGEHQLGDRDGPVEGPPPAPGHVLARNHDRLADTRMLHKGGLDLTEFNAEPADLHLVIKPTQKLQIAVRQIANEMPGPI